VTNAGDEPILAAMKATKTIPIIFETGSDPIARGFVASLAHPEGNLTGVSWMAHELGGKRLELLKEAVPNLTRIAILSDPEQRSYPVQMTDLKALPDRSPAEPTGTTVGSSSTRKGVDNSSGPAI
jgi:putative ABC transport system substrate-binding protein